jgi:hypothetical protein
MPPPVNNFSIAGDIAFNTGQNFNLNSTFDMFTVAAHEFGHALGLNHTSATSLAEMYPSYTGAKPTLNSDDIAGIRNIYSGNNPRSQDVYDAAGLGNSFSTAVNLSQGIDPSTQTELVNNLDITTTSDSDYYTFNTPQLPNGSFSISVQSSGLSLLSPKVTVYAADQKTVVGSAGGLNQYGTTLTVNVTNATSLSPYYVLVQGADTTSVGTGKYALGLSFAGNPIPIAPSSIYPIANGNPISGGGGLADGAGESDDYMSSVPVITGISQDTGLSTNDGVTNDNTLIIRGQGPPGSTVQLYNNGQFIGTAVTGQAVSNGVAVPSTTWWFDNTRTALADGTYAFTATATDVSGNVSALSDPFTVIINTQAPPPPTIGGITPDTGASSSDGVTRSNTPTLSGTAAPNSQVTLYSNGQSTSVVNADSTGAWSYASPPLVDGSYNFTAVATNLAGNVSPVSKSFVVTIDTSINIPAIAGVAMSARSTAGTSGLVVLGTAEAGASVVVYRRGVPIGTAGVDAAGNWSFGYAPPAGSTVGILGFTAVATDLAGNVSAQSNVFKLQVDNSAPTVSTPSLAGWVGGTAGAVGSPVLIGQAMPGSVVTILDGNTILGTTTASTLGFWMFASPTLAAGKHTIYAEATNALGVTGLLSGGLTLSI